MASRSRPWQPKRSRPRVATPKVRRRQPWPPGRSGSRGSLPRRGRRPPMPSQPQRSPWSQQHYVTHNSPPLLLVLVLRCEAGHQLVPKWVDARRARLRGLRCSVAGAVAGWMLTTMAPFGLVECAIRGVRTQPILGRLHRLIHNPPPASPPSIACELPRSHPPRGLASPRRPQSAPRSHLSSSLAL